MQVELRSKLLLMYLKRILEKTFPGVSAAARLQQIGLFTLIYALQDEEEPVTAARLAKMTELSDGQVLTHLRRLMEIELIERAQIKNKQGRGRAYKLTIKDTKETKRLLRAINKTVAGRKS